MKIIRFNYKQVLTGFFAMGLLAIAQPSFGQIYSTNTDDIQADGSQGYGHSILNTGTDAISITNEQAEALDITAGNLQVMVWDGDQPTLSWSGSNGAGSIGIEGCFRDPDVVVHVYDNSLYAMVAYEDEGGNILYNVYRWQNGVFDHVDGSMVGNNEPLGEGTRLKGENPNIDVNSEGTVVLTWHESFSYPATQVISYSGFTHTYNFLIVRSEIYAVFGRIDGTSLTGISGLRGIGTGPNGDKISLTATLLYEHNKYPDVALSERDSNGKYAVTFTYSKMYFEPLSFNVGKNWVIDQRILDASTTPTLTSGSYIADAHAGSQSYRPRVASRKIAGAYAHDYEAVTGPVHRGCNENGYYTYSPIYNVGRYNNTTRTSAAIVNAGYTDTENNEPVVSYRYGSLGTSNAEYIVSWTMNVNFGPAHQRNLNVMAATLKNGVRQGAQIGYVNRGNASADPSNEPLMDAQYIPSIAGIYSSAENQYLFVDLETANNNNDVKFKGGDQFTPGTSGKPGTSALRQANFGKGSGFAASPNPFSDEVRFNVKVEGTDAAQTLIITDLTGKLVDKLDVQNLKEGVHSLTWKSRTALPAGVYLAKLQTREKVTTIRIVKQ